MSWRVVGAFLGAAFAFGGSAEAVGPGEAAPPLVGETLDGGRFDLADLRGKVVVVNFWATWCAPCREELPQLVALARRLEPSGVALVTVDVDTDKAPAKALLATLGLAPVAVWDPKGAIAGKFEPPAMPSTFVVGRDGVVRAVLSGFDAGTLAAIEEAAALASPAAGGSR
jgi:cytochrome c biogenesis protein CcmG/thiol:disulfide interchange protein DsbE